MELFQDYMKIEEVARQWNVTPRRVQALCATGKIKGATRFGREWMIPKDTPKPIDGRTKDGRREWADPTMSSLPMPRKTPFLHMTDLYSLPGTAEACIETLVDNREAQILLAAGIAYSQGHIDEVYASAKKLLDRHSGFFAVISAGMLLALCAIWRGDLGLWRQAKLHIIEAPAKTEKDREIITFSITAIDSMLYNVENFPEWFKIGRFEILPKDSFPAAKVFYAKYLYAAGYGVATKQIEVPGVQGMALMAMLPNAVEPMIAQAAADKSLIAEIYLRMVCAVIYHSSDNDAQAIYHLDKAIALALPDKLYGLLAEYRRTLDSLLEQRLTLADEAAWEQVNTLYRIYNEGWSKLSGSVRGRTIITSLTPKQREVAKLAAFGMRNEEIAQKLHMSVSAVKQAVRKVSTAAGVTREEFAAIL